MTNKEIVNTLEFLKIAILVDAKPMNVNVEALDLAIKAIEERKQGEWKEPMRSQWNVIQADVVVCPFCGATPHKHYKNFCPKCGADMRGVDHEQK